LQRPTAQNDGGRSAAGGARFGSGTLSAGGAGSIFSIQHASPTLDLAEFQAVERDFAFLVDAKVAAADIVKAATCADCTLIESVTIFDVYEGKGVDPGKKSLAISVRLQPQDRTLTEAEIEAVSSKILGAVAKATGATLRG